MQTQLYFLLLAMFVGLNIRAQGLQGDWLLKGIVQFDHFTSIASQNIQDVNMRSQTGYFIGNGFCVGTLQKAEYRTSDSHFFSVQPFVRVAVFLDKISPFLELSAGVGHEKISGFSRSSKTRYGYLGLKSGLSLIIDKNASFDMALGYHKSYKYEAGVSHSKASSIVMGEFGMTYYLTKDHRRDDAFSIAELYLKQGNKSIGVDGGEYIIGTFLTRLEWTTTPTDRLRLSTTFNNYFRHPKNGLLIFNTLNIEAQPYIPLKGKAFFVPAFGIYATSNRSRSAINYPDSYFANITPSLVYIGKRNILKIGFETLRLFYQQDALKYQISASTMLEFQHFLSPKLALKVQGWGNLTGINWGQDSYIFWEATGATHFQLGFEYFYRRKNKK